MGLWDRSPTYNQSFHQIYRLEIVPEDQGAYMYFQQQLSSHSLIVFVNMQAFPAPMSDLITHCQQFVIVPACLPHTWTDHLIMTCSGIDPIPPLDPHNLYPLPDPDFASDCSASSDCH